MFKNLTSFIVASSTLFATSAAIADETWTSVFQVGSSHVTEVDQGTGYHDYIAHQLVIRDPLLISTMLDQKVKDKSGALQPLISSSDINNKGELIVTLNFQYGKLRADSAFEGALNGYDVSVFRTGPNNDQMKIDFSPLVFNNGVSVESPVFSSVLTNTGFFSDLSEELKTLAKDVKEEVKDFAGNPSVRETAKDIK